ncbi:hypothetical protein ACIBHY_29620 [Nonomuraea sp. NPDC050547]|uniref:hypothetical protein n=1 Tax=Nonomuraea sp. NPDC050547 TaxID=3364368 RepID=UPI003793D572
MSSPSQTKRTGINVDEAAALYKQGWTLRRIASRQRCSFQRLSTLLRERADVEMRSPSHPRALRLTPVKQAAIRDAVARGMNQSEIGRQVGVTPSTVARLAEREGLDLLKGKRLSWDVDRARQLRADNVPYTRIASEVGVAAMTVWRRLNPRTTAARAPAGRGKQR